ncbi:MAG: DUF4395 domain-containing protein [Bacteroidales bacterium]|nr:DUF4395 domain-containing protein [Bacteroidales bacterium]
MKTFAFCPISDKRIDERVARTNAAFTVLLILLFAITQSVLPIVFLVIDFLIRASDNAKYSLLAITSKGIVNNLQWNRVMINAGPKIFAARIGFFLSTLIAIAFILNFKIFAFVLGGILGLFSFLEALLGLCVACEIYPFLYRFLYKGKFQEVKPV